MTEQQQEPVCPAEYAEMRPGREFRVGFGMVNPRKISMGPEYRWEKWKVKDDTNWWHDCASIELLSSEPPSELSQLREALAQAQQERDEARARVGDLEKDLNDQIMGDAAVMLDLSAQITDLKSRLSAALAQIAALEKRIAGARTALLPVLHQVSVIEEINNHRDMSPMGILSALSMGFAIQDNIQATLAALEGEAKEREMGSVCPNCGRVDRDKTTPKCYLC